MRQDRSDWSDGEDLVRIRAVNKPMRIYASRTATHPQKLRKALSVDFGSSTGLKEDMGSLRLLLYSAESTLENMQEKADNLQEEVCALRKSITQLKVENESLTDDRVGLMRKVDLLTREVDSLHSVALQSQDELRQTGKRHSRTQDTPEVTARGPETSKTSKPWASGSRPSHSRLPHNEANECQGEEEGGGAWGGVRMTDWEQEKRPSLTESDSGEVNRWRATSDEQRTVVMHLEDENKRLKCQIEQGNRKQWLSSKRALYVPNQLQVSDLRLIHGRPSSRLAHVVLVMRGDAYSLGAAVLAKRIKNLGSEMDVVCMVTSDVSSEAIEGLACVFDVIYEVPYLDFVCERLTTKKQQQYYEEWISKSFTKWNALALCHYEKVLLMDADLLPVQSVNELFELDAPAATFSSPWSKAYKDDGYEDPYVELRHADKVPSKLIEQAVEFSLQHSEGGKGSYVALGSLVLLEPSYDRFMSLQAFVASRQPFGVPGMHSGFDEQSIVLFYATHCPHKPWRHISQAWNCMAWHDRWVQGTEPKAFHFFNAKPWEMSPSKYPDLKVWYAAANELLRENKDTGVLFNKCLGSARFMKEFQELEENVAESATRRKAFKMRIAAVLAEHATPTPEPISKPSSHHHHHHQQHQQSPSPPYSTSPEVVRRPMPHTTWNDGQSKSPLASLPTTSPVPHRVRPMPQSHSQSQSHSKSLDDDWRKGRGGPLRHFTKEHTVERRSSRSSGGYENRTTGGGVRQGWDRQGAKFGATSRASSSSSRPVRADHGRWERYPGSKDGRW